MNVQLRSDVVRRTSDRRPTNVRWIDVIAIALRTSATTKFPTDGGVGELRTSVYPSNLAPISAKLRQNTFQTICSFSFFDPENKKNGEKKSEKNSGSMFVFEKVRFWRSYEFPSVIGTSVVKSYCPNCPYFWGDFLGEG